MGNLSQSEIDALLGDLNLVGDSPSEGPGGGAAAPPAGFLSQFEPMEGKEEAPRVSKVYRLYDFRRPEKLSKDHIRVLRSHFGLFWRKVANYLANLSRTSVDLALVEVDQIAYKDIFTSHGVPVVMCTFLCPPDTQGLIKMNLGQYFGLVERLMGGSGTSNLKSRALTEFERSLCQEMFSQMMACYAEIRREEPYPLEIIEVDERLMPRSLSSDELMVRAIYDLRIGSSSGYLNLYVPLRALGPVLGSSNQAAASTATRTTHVPPVVGRLPLELSVVLGETWLAAGEVAELKPGSVLALDQAEQAPLKVRVGGVPRFRGRPGLRGNRLAVTLMGKWEES